ncbi:hypothetical protein ISN44_As01g011370 [Arabidopsis suecica]|uniref:Uncharacterized protein n=1 Tax=Arabidopsis suecica TaxID=45249 RepID=A0A8T2H3F2_ARASU|nr:hypothetical protein ISN44_As01g011370 [Arabidopsis suecica]
MLNLRRMVSGSLHLWKREMKISTPMRTMAPFSSSSSSSSSAAENATPPLTIGDGASASSCDAENAKSSIFEKLRSLTSETLDFIIREEEKKGVSVTQADLVSSAKQLLMEGKRLDALQIFMWMYRKKMSFSTSELALFVDIIAKTIGLPTAHAYLKKVDPDCDRMHNPTENWPAFVSLLLLETELLAKRGIVPAVRNTPPRPRK